MFSDQIHVWSIPMRTPFRGLKNREGVLIRGSAGWGEFSPFIEYGPAETARWWAAALHASQANWPQPLRDKIPVNVTVPAVGPTQAMHIVHTSGGCRTAKVKVAERGQSEAQDIARVEAVRDAIGATGKVRIDANGAWSVDQAIRMLRALRHLELEYVEQPCATLEEMAQLRRRIDIPLAADESVRKAEDPLRVVGLAAADIVVLKVQPLGGVRAALEVAESCGLPVVVSSALETSVGLAAGVALAAALPELPYACGLATSQLLAGDLVANSLSPVDGALPVDTPVVDERLLTRFAASEARVVWWQKRIEQVKVALTQSGSCV